MSNVSYIANEKFDDKINTVSMINMSTYVFIISSTTLKEV